MEQNADPSPGRSRSMPPSAVIPELGDGNVRAAAEWLCRDPASWGGASIDAAGER